MDERVASFTSLLYKVIRVDNECALTLCELDMMLTVGEKNVGNFIDVNGKAHGDLLRPIVEI